MGSLEELMPEQQSCIEELKRRTFNDLTPKLLEDPSLFYRFSKARDFNLKQAESMLRKHILFRKEYKVDTILDDFVVPEVLKKYFTPSLAGYDKDGNPIRFVSMGNLDLKGIFKSAKKSDIMKYNIVLAEEDLKLLRQQSEKLGKPITSFVLIGDYSNFTFAKATHKDTIEMMTLNSRIYQDNYPELMKSAYIINASSFFSLLFSFVKSILAPALLEKIHIFGSERWKEALLEVIDPDVLPAFLGGNRTDPDGNPLCKTFIYHGELIPESYYLKKSKRILHLEPDVKKLSVIRSSSADVKLEVDKPGSILEWIFETKSKDIEFSITFKDKTQKEPKAIELVPKQRIDTSFEPESGMFKCEKAGTYIFTFDNSYSKISSKEVWYKISVIAPKELVTEI